MCYFIKKNDSVIKLIHGPISDISLVITRVNYDNLVRFLSGINDKKITKKHLT